MTSQTYAYLNHEEQCMNCLKSDVCKYKEEYQKLKTDISSHFSQTPNFLKINIQCKFFQNCNNYYGTLTNISSSTSTLRGIADGEMEIKYRGLSNE